MPSSRLRKAEQRHRAPVSVSDEPGDAATTCRSSWSHGARARGGREAVRVVLHALEQPPRGRVGIRPGRLARLDPAAVEVRDERPERAARVIELLGPSRSSRRERSRRGSRPAGDRSGRASRSDRRLLEAGDEIPTGPVRDEPPWLERDLDGGLQRVSPALSPDHSGRRFLVMASQRFLRRACGPAHACTSRWYAAESSSKTAASHSAQSS